MPSLSGAATLNAGTHSYTLTKKCGDLNFFVISLLKQANYKKKNIQTKHFLKMQMLEHNVHVIIGNLFDSSKTNNHQWLWVCF